VVIAWNNGAEKGRGAGQVMRLGICTAISQAEYRRKMTARASS